MSSMKLKKPMRKLSNSESSSLSKRSQKRTDQFDREYCHSSERNKQIQASPLTPHSSFSSSSDKTRKISSFSRQTFNSSTMTDRKFKRCFVKKQPEVPQILKSSIERATFSSIVKDSKFPNLLDLEAEGSSTIKVCSFTYCSLHGHHHNNVPPLKSLVSIRRHLLMNQRSEKKERQVPNKGNSFVKIKKDKQTCQLVSNVQETETKSSSISRCGEKVEEICDFDNLNDLSKSGQHAPTKLEQPEETSLYCSCCTITKRDVPVFKSTIGKDETFCSLCNEGCDSGSESSGKSLKVCDIYGNKRVEKFRSNPAKNEEEATSGSTIIISNASHDELLEEQQAKDNQEVNREFSTNNDFKQLKNHKYVRMWHLVYKHAMNTKEQVEYADSESLLGKKNSESSKDVDKENQNLGNQEIEQNKIDAVKLVQEAFDQIKDLSSDDQLSTSDIDSEKEWSTKSSIDIFMDNIEESQGETKIKTEHTSAQIEETSNKEGEKPDQKVPKRWNKVILVKRFVKALEKVRRINNWIPLRYLPFEPDAEAEKVSLRHQIMEERKNTDELMLDYALQKVISTLAPAQQRKVALLVEAFETVVPLSGMKCSFRSISKHSSQTCQYQVFNESTARSGGNPEILLEETLSAITNNKQEEESSAYLMEKQQTPDKIFE